MPEFLISNVRILAEESLLVDIACIVGDTFEWQTSWTIAALTLRDVQNLDGNQDALRAVARLWAARHDVEITFVDAQARVV